MFQDNKHFYLLSSSRKGGYNWWNWPSSWALKRISSKSTSNYFNQALGSELSVPGVSEVLWKENLPYGTGECYGYTYICIIMYQCRFLTNLNPLNYLGGWEPFIPFKFSIKHRPKSSLIHLRGWERGKLLFNETIYDKNNSESLKGGKIGLLAHSQAFLRFSNLSYRFKLILV